MPLQVLSHFQITKPFYPSVSDPLVAGIAHLLRAWDYQYEGHELDPWLGSVPFVAKRMPTARVLSKEDASYQKRMT